MKNVFSFFLLLFATSAIAFENSCIRFYDSHLKPAFYFQWDHGLKGKTSDRDGSFLSDNFANKTPTANVWRTTIQPTYRPDDIFPEMDPTRRLVIGFDNGHSYFYFNGHRFDSKGTIGVRVTSYLDAKPMMQGEVLFFLPDIPQSAIDALNSMIANFRKKSGLTCIRVTCKYLKQAGILDRNDFYRADSLFYHLMDMKLKDNSIQVVYTPKMSHNLLQNMRSRYHHVIEQAKKISILAAPVGAAAIDLALSYLPK